MCRLYYPHIISVVAFIFGLGSCVLISLVDSRFHKLLICIESLLELMVLIRKHIALWNEIKLKWAKLIAHLHEVQNEFILACQLCRVQEVIHSLVLTKSIVYLLFMVKTTAAPQ